LFFDLFFSGAKRAPINEQNGTSRTHRRKKPNMATVFVPTPLRRLTGGQSKVEATGQDIAAVFQAMDEQFPGVSEKLLDEDGHVKRFINVFVNDDEIRSLQGMSTPVKESDRVSIVPAMAGGQRS